MMSEQPGPVIGVASDHAGVDLRHAVIQHLKDKGWTVRDFGCQGQESMDYPDTVIPCAQALGRGEVERAVVICGSGIGASISANKVAGVRCALCLSEEMGRLGRQHNDANCLGLAARLNSEEANLVTLEAWLQTPFEGGRHTRRIEKLHRLSGC